MYSRKIPVYIIDDDDAVRIPLARSLKLRGFRVASFSDALEFLDSIDSLPAGCVVSDVRLSGLSGLDLQHALTDSATSYPIILITGDGDSSLSKIAIERGAIGYLEKPFRPDRLVQLIERAHRVIGGSDPTGDKNTDH